MTFGRVPLVLGLAILAHNIEELATLPLLPDMASAAADLLGLHIAVPPLRTVQIGIALFALVPLAILARAQSRPGPRFAFVMVMIAAMSATNAVVPHAVLAVATGGYVPGLVTALFTTFPVGCWAIASAWRRRWIKPPTIILAVLTGVILLPAVLFGFWALGELIAELSS